jgi:hypothetical protein
MLLDHSFFHFYRTKSTSREAFEVHRDVRGAGTDFMKLHFGRKVFGRIFILVLHITEFHSKIQNKNLFYKNGLNSWL